MQKKQKVEITDIDFFRNVIVVAFYKDTEVDNAQLESGAELDGIFDSNSENHWGGVFQTFKSVLLNLLIKSYTDLCHYSHCEVSFFPSEAGRRRFGDKCMISASARSDKGVNIVTREFNDKYTWIRLKVSESEQRQIVAFLFEQVGKPYDSSAAFKSLTWPRPTRGNSWYCSELVQSALLFIPCPFIQSQRANCVEIDEIANLVRKSQRSRNQSPANIIPRQIEGLYEDNADAFDTIFGLDSN